MTEFKKTVVGEEDVETAVLAALAGGNAYVFVVAELNDDGGLDIRLSVGNGVSRTDTIRVVLEKVLSTLPDS